MSDGTPSASTDSEAAVALPDNTTGPSDRLLKQRIYGQLFPSLTRPTAKVDRFTLLRELGRGGMGVVFAAYDDKLDRKVAIKLLHQEASRDRAARARLEREAQALARLSHPNVVQVHEAGLHDEQVYLVMEYVEGVTLRQWLERAPPLGQGRWRAVVRSMIEAGEGLAAAHDAGLTHRDFKPDNLLVGVDGRVRVVDFGLAARGEDPVTSGDHSSGDLVRTERAGPERLTRTGAALGTVSYMPLEQARGDVVDARSDQFSFCVTLYEALFDTLPFPGRTRGAVMLALDEGSPRVPETVGKIPKWLRRALWRGLARDPEDRHTDMRSLLAALSRPLIGRRLGMASAVLLVAAGAVVGAGSMQSFDEPAPPCAEAGRAIDEAWNPEARSKLVAALEPDIADLAVNSIDHWSNDWRAAARDTCEQVHVDKLASPDSLDTRGRCLDQRRHELSLVLRELESMRDRGGPAVAELLAVLGEPADCMLDGADPLHDATESQRQEHRRLSEQLISIDVVQSGLAVAERRTRARALYEEAKRAGIDSLRARAAYVLGRLALLAGDREATERWLGEAIDLAEQTGDDETRVLSWLRLSESALYFELSPTRATWLWERARAPLAVFPRPHAMRARSELSRGRIHLAAGELAEAASQVDAAIEQLQSLGPIASLHLHRALRLRGLVASRRGRGELAVALSRRARQVLRLQPDGTGESLDLGVARFDEGVALLRTGKLDQAREVLRDAWDRIERERPDSRRLARVHVALSAVADGRGELEQARREAEAADAILRQIGGGLDPERVTALSARGVAAFRAEAFADAAESFGLALRIAESEPEPTRSSLAFHAVNLAEARLALGYAHEAETMLDNAVGTLEAELGNDHPELAIPYKARGSARLTLGRLHAAEADLRRSLALHLRTGESPTEAAQTRWLLARTLGELGQTTAAHEQAATAATEFDSLGPSWSTQAARARALAQPPTSP